ncbi:MAG: HYR domain-containing protein, partial [Bacteroidota bacterium]|nr:HYR domain-containing protein [Bacteroidota bacterium]
SYTPLTTGAYSLQVTAASGGYIDYFYKIASGGCNATGWTCILDINAPGTFPIGTLTAGTTYYILADPETTGSYSHTFNINCVIPDPCTSIVTLACNTAVTANLSGGGAWSPGSCGFSTPGQERVYSFTPITTGVHNLQVNSASGGFADYFFKAASGGCNATGWTCIGNVNAPVTKVIGTLTAGTQYYILLDAEATTALTQNFQVVCTGAPPPCATNPSPANGDISCPNTPTTLSWTASPGATSYDIYFGTTPVPPFVNNILTTSYNAGTLAAGTYYWQVRPRNMDGPAGGCTIWTFTKADNTPPTITCPPNITVSATQGLCSAVTTYGAISATDNCSAPTITLVSGLASGSSFPVGLTAIVYRATDQAGNSSTCSFTVRVLDTQPPSISCPASVTVQCASTIPVPNIAGVVASDNCGPPTVVFVSDVTTGFVCTNRFNVTRTYRATDASGNSSQCTQSIVVFDNTAPSITFSHPLLMGVPNGGTIEVQCYGQDPTWDPPVFNQSSITATDNCSGTPTIIYTETLIDEGNCTVDGYINLYRLRWVITDVCGNSSSASVQLKLVDTIPPVLFGVPEDITVNCDEVPAVPAADAITALDECLFACTITFAESSPTPGCQDGQVLQRKWTATDECGNSTVAIQYLTLVDEKGPELYLTLPQLQGIDDGTVLEYTCNEGGIPAFYNQLGTQSVSFVAACGGTPSISMELIEHEPRNCEFFGYVEQREFIWTGIDACGNESTFTLTVHLIDHEEPVLINVPDLACDGDPSLAEVEAIDNCENGSVRYWDVVIPNPCGIGNAKRRTYEGFDPCGNMVRDTTILLPQDDVAPQMEFVNPVLQGLGQGQTLILDCASNAGYFDLFSEADVSVTDDCTEGLTISYDERLLSLGNCTTEEGVLASLQLEWTATDMCGNQSQLAVLVNIMDQTPPVMENFRAEVTVGCGDALPSLQASDNCGEVVMTTNEVVIPGGCENEYDVERTIVVSDPCGNTLSTTQVVHVW